MNLPTPAQPSPLSSGLPNPHRPRPSLPGGDHASIPEAERRFFVEEFRGITIVIALGEVGAVEEQAADEVVDGFRAGDTRLVFVVGSERSAARVAARVGAHLAAGQRQSTDWRAALWLTATDHRTVVIAAEAEPVELTAARVAVGLRAAKVVFTDPRGGWPDPPRSFADLARVGEAVERDLTARGLPQLRFAMEQALNGGAFSVNLCRAEDLDAELFTFDGAGTLFTDGGYVRLTDLRVDDFPAVLGLIDAGIADGVLRPRTRTEVAQLAIDGLGARVIRTGHLAGVVGLERAAYQSEQVGEICALITVSQFAGFGVGALLVDGLIQRGRQFGLRALFAVTVSQAAAAFFLRCGFEQMSIDDVPPQKWRDYDPARRAVARAFRRPTDSAGG